MISFFKRIKISNKNRNENEISFLNFPLIQYGTIQKNNTTEKYIKVFPSKKYYQKELDKIINFYGDQKHDVVFIYRIDALGEIYLLSQMLFEYVEKYNVQNIAIITYKKSVQAVCKMFLPNIKCYLFEDYNIAIFNNLFTKCHFKYKNIKFNVFPQTLPEVKKLYGEYYAKQNGKMTFPQYILNKFNIEKYRNIKPCFNVQNIKKLVPNLNLNNFIFIIPEANSVIELPVTFWKNLIKEAQDKGFDIYINSTNDKFNFINSPKLTIEESVYLSSFAKHIVSIRTGFLELLLHNNVPKQVIYTNRKRDPISPSKMQEIFNLNNYPNINSSIKEYCVDKTSESNIITQIMEEISNENIPNDSK